MLMLAICDDEPFMAEELSSLLSSYMEERGCTSWDICCFPDGKALLDSDGNFDLILLDIQMKGMDGMETARKLRQRGNQSILIFITVLKECVFDAFQVQAFDFLVKPLDPDRFRQILNRAIAWLEQREQRRMQKRTPSIMIQRGSAREIILLSKIRYCDGRSTSTWQAGPPWTTMGGWRSWSSRWIPGFSAATEATW